MDRVTHAQVPPHRVQHGRLAISSARLLEYMNSNNVYFTYLLPLFSFPTF